MTQITDILMKKRLQQVIFMGFPAFELIHHNKGFFSNSSWKFSISLTKGLVSIGMYS